MLDLACSWLFGCLLNPLCDPYLHCTQEDTDEERRRAWEFGLPSDSQQDWSRRLSELRAYRDCHGDAHVGFREVDAPELTRWAAKQRSDWRSSAMRSDRWRTHSPRLSHTNCGAQI